MYARRNLPVATSALPTAPSKMRSLVTALRASLEVVTAPLASEPLCSTLQFGELPPRVLAHVPRRARRRGSREQSFADRFTR